MKTIIETLVLVTEKFSICPRCVRSIPAGTMAIKQKCRHGGVETLYHYHNACYQAEQQERPEALFPVYYWIPITERLPDDGQDVLVISDDGQATFVISASGPTPQKARFHALPKPRFTSCHPLPTTTHWFPCPVFK